MQIESVRMQTPPQRSFAERLEAFFWRHLNRRLPRTRGFDYLAALLWFVRYQHRLPARKPALFNDHLFWIKTSDEIMNPLRVFTSDKEYLKMYVKATVGDAHNVPTFAVLRSFEECERYEFPMRCVIKPTHMSGTVILRRAGEPIDLEKIRGWFRTNLYVEIREANYRHLRPKVIVEPFVFDDDNPNDYKIFCARGKPRLIQVDSDRYMDHVQSFYDVHWRRQPYAITSRPSPVDAPRPANLDLMLDLAATLSADLSLVRVDFYSNGEQALLGELTHCHRSSIGVFMPREAEADASRLIFGP